jgi:hypothetical protein
MRKLLRPLATVITALMAELAFQMMLIGGFYLLWMAGRLDHPLPAAIHSIFFNQSFALSATLDLLCFVALVEVSRRWIFLSQKTDEECCIRN